MNLFSKLFNPKGQRNLSIFDLFKTDIKNIPDDSFSDNGIIENSNGTSIRVFTKKLPYKECGVFDFVEIYIIGEEKYKNIFFKSFTPNSITFKNMESLINELYQFNGADQHNHKGFCKRDKELYYDPKFFQLFTRHWTDAKYPMWLSRESNEVSLVLHGVNKWE